VLVPFDGIALPDLATLKKMVAQRNAKRHAFALKREPAGPIGSVLVLVALVALVALVLRKRRASTAT